MKIFNSGLIHPFMFGLFPILFIFTNNLTEISLDSLLIPVIVIFGVITFLTFTLIKISKNIQKAALTMSFLLLLFFSIGYIRIWLYGFQIFGFALDQVVFLISIYFVIFVVGLFSIYKIKDLSKLTQIISIVSIVVILSFLPNIVLGLTNYDHSNKNNFDTEIKFDSIKKPNIYYIILDGYASEESLKNNFNFDNSKFLNYLRDLGFIVAEDNFSNYGATGLSMTSALNMNYIDYLDNQQGFSPNKGILEKSLFSNNLVMKTLQDNGYTTIYIDGGGPMRDMYVANKILCHSTDNGLLQTLIDTSMMTYIYQKFFWDSWYEIRNCSFSELEKVHENSKTPFFVYAHLRTPHDPYFTDADGNFIQYDERADELDEKTANERYIYQLQYTNKKMNEIITKLMSLEQKPIIIISSDHGWGQQFASSPPTDEDLIQWHSNFEAFYLPNIDNYEPYRKITPINIFRSIFNDYFGTHLEVLENKAYYVNFENKTNFMDQTDITDIINSKK